MAGKVRIVNNLPKIVNDTQRRLVGAMTQALVRAGGELASLVPIDTSALLNSQYRDTNQFGSRVVGKIGFTAEYAAAVHEASGKLKGLPRPKRNGRERGRFWGPHDGQPGFLTEAVRRAKPDIDDIVRKAVKR